MGGPAGPALVNMRCPGFFVHLTHQQNGAGFRGHNFKDQFQQLGSAKARRIANGVDGLGNLEQGVQVAGHAANIDGKCAV